MKTDTTNAISPRAETRHDCLITARFLLAAALKELERALGTDEAFSLAGGALHSLDNISRSLRDEVRP